LRRTSWQVVLQKRKAKEVQPGRKDKTRAGSSGYDKIEACGRIARSGRLVNRPYGNKKRQSSGEIASPWGVKQEKRNANW